MSKKIKHALDKALDKVVSRKLLAWATACALLFAGSLDSEQWGMVTIVYIGSQAATDIMERFRFGPKES